MDLLAYHGHGGKDCLGYPNLLGLVRLAPIVRTHLGDRVPLLPGRACSQSRCPTGPGPRSGSVGRDLGRYLYFVEASRTPRYV